MKKVNEDEKPNCDDLEDYLLKPPRVDGHEAEATEEGRSVSILINTGKFSDDFGRYFIIFHQQQW